MTQTPYDVPTASQPWPALKAHQWEQYRCPCDGSTLRVCEPATANDGFVVTATLRCEQHHEFPIVEGVADLTWPPVLNAVDEDARSYYEENASTYDKYAYLTYMTYGEDEDDIINYMVDRLSVNCESAVLEVGCGTGRSSRHIASRLGPEAKLYLQEFSPQCLDLAVEKLRDLAVPMEFAVSNGCYIPLPDNCVDATYHFGGLNVFSDIGRALREMARVTRVGGRVVVSDESMPIWLRDTEFGKIMMNSNPLLKYDVPLQHIPVCARDVKVEWILGGVFYLIHFTVGEGEPTANMDFEIPTKRGGTHRTRYEGHLEGITPEAKQLAQQARDKTGKSMFRWLDDVVRQAAQHDIQSGETA